MFSFKVNHTSTSSSARLGTISTAHGDIATPAFTVVGTNAAVKEVTIDSIMQLETQAVLANTYHLLLQPGPDIIEQVGGFGKFMGWSGPTFTDSGGFQVFSLGIAYGQGIGKVAASVAADDVVTDKPLKSALASIDDEGVNFRSHRNGAMLRLTPESSMQTQWKLGADVIFAFDECTAPTASLGYQKQALERTHAWAKRCIDEHKKLKKAGGVNPGQTLYAVVQGGRHQDLRQYSAQTLAEMDYFGGFGIGGSFTKDDLGTAVRWTNQNLPDNKPRHLLGIGEPRDIFAAVAEGCDTFDCVSPTRVARHGRMYTANGPVNITNARFKTDLSLLDETTPSPVGQKYTKAYVAHLYRAHEDLGGMIVSIHNLAFMLKLMKDIRAAIADDTFDDFSKVWLKRYYG